MDIANNQDKRTLAIMCEVLKRVNKNRLDELEWEDFHWILCRVDILHILNYGYNVLNSNTFCQWDNCRAEYNYDFVDWRWDEDDDCNVHTEWLSESTEECITKAIRRYNLYGKWFLKLKWLWYKFWLKITGVL